MRTDPRMLLRGFAKFVAVVVASGLVGAGIGIALANLSGDDGAGGPVLPATTAQAAQTSTTTTSTTAQASSGTVYRVPRVEILDAQLVTTQAGGSRVTARVRVTNRGTRPLTIKQPVLVSGDDEVRLDTARAAARPLLKAIDPGKRATGVLRFATSDALTQRLTETPRARLRIANRTVALTLTPAEATTG